MSVTNGQRANQATLNSAFVSRNSDSSTVGKLDLQNVLPESGDEVLNIQREHNSTASFLGKPLGSAWNILPAWVSNAVGLSSDSVKAKIDALVERFLTSGHTHDGTDGEGARVIKPNVLPVIASQAASGSVEDLLISGLSTTRITGGPVTLQGIIAEEAGYQFTLINQTGAVLTIANLATISDPTYRIVTGTGSDLAIEDGAAIVFEYDAVSSLWRTLGGPGGGGGETLGFSESPAGLINGVNTTFGPFSLVPVNDDSIQVFVDGVFVEKADYSVTGGDTIDLSFAPVPGQQVDVFYLYKSDSSTSPSIGLGQTPKTEYVTLSAGQIAAKAFTLAQTPLVPSEILLDTVSGTINEFGVDFTVSGNTVSWDTLALDGVLTAGDKIRVHYYF